MDLGTDSTKAQVSSLASSPRVWEPTVQEQTGLGRRKGQLGDNSLALRWLEMGWQFPALLRVAVPLGAGGLGSCILMV